ncbi:MAG TPA: redoxin domain-containing protein [Anaerolineae bacterium]|nr:redoxin domain-containing protein [Anaerolineae bacterium]HQI86589.1 redoxin domain-containing protein [Anaerolineae bacterium]
MRNKGGRWLAALLTVAAAALMGGLGLWLLNRPARPLSSGVAQAVATPAPRTLFPTAAPAASQDAVAWINGNPLPREALAQRQAMDRALNALFNIPAADEETAVDRLVNEVLLLSAAESAGFSVAPETVTAEREALLAAYGKSTAELEAALLAEGFPLAAFDAYLANLITARDFSAAQAKARGMTPEAFILELRQATDVRLAAGSVVARPQMAAPIASPTPTATPLKATPLKATPTETFPTPTPIAPAPVLTATSVSASSADDVPRGTGVGQRAPDFALLLLGSDPPSTLDLDALRGQPVVLSFWVTWCSHCRAQTPLLVEAHAREAATGVQFVGVNVRETADLVQPYVDKQGILYPVVLDADGRTAQQYQVSGYPTTYFLDAEGRVVARHVGQLNAQTLEQYLALLR